MRIKWIRLKKIATEIAKRPVAITLTTKMDERMNAACVFNSENVDILLSADNCKSVNMIIKAIAHELAHVVNNSDSHDGDFQYRADEIEKIIRTKYGEGKK